MVNDFNDIMQENIVWSPPPSMLTKFRVKIFNDKIMILTDQLIINSLNDSETYATL